MIDDLLELAAYLARRDARRPKQSSLRRAMSTAYYAVFHAHARLCAGSLVGPSKPWQVFTPIYRSLEHTAAKRLFDQARSDKRFGDEIADLGRIFIRLQQARHAADYSPEPFSISRDEALELIGLARQAVQTIHMLPDDKRLLLAVNLIARQR
jgi:uncharacterized protein (UPF0332 family)